MAREAEQRKVALSYIHDFLVKSDLEAAAASLLDQALLANTATREEILRRPTNALIGIIADWRTSHASQLKDNEWFAAECNRTRTVDAFIVLT